MSVTTPIQEKTHSTCKHCDITYPATSENFYIKKGKLVRDICKSCKCEKSKIYESNRLPREQRVRNRQEYSKAYYLKKKALLNFFCQMPFENK